MKIHSLYSNFIPQQVRNNISSSSLKYQYNLSADVVSFSGNDVITENSKEIFDFIKNKKFEDLRYYLENVVYDDYDPNYVQKISESGKKYSIVSLMISEYKNGKYNNEDFFHLLHVITNIVLHSDFSIINSKNNEDIFAQMLEANFPKAVIGLITQTAAFDKLIDESPNKLDLYYKISEDLKRDDIVEILDDYKTANKSRLGDKRSVVKSVVGDLEQSEHIVGVSASKLSSDEIDKEVMALRKTLLPYKTLFNDNDPESLDDIGGMFETKKAIRNFVVKPWDSKYEKIIKENHLKRPSGILLSGPPGCGKTYIVKSIAAETGYDMYEINLGNIGSSTAYETSKNFENVAKTFEKLYRLTGVPSIVLFDEVESIGGNRKKMNTDWKIDDINAFLMFLNNSSQRGMIVIGATNFEENVDEAIKRSGRLDKHISVNLPNFEERKDIIEKILINFNVAKNLIWESEKMAQKTDGLSPATISTILNNACLEAIYDDRQYATYEDFEKMFDELNNKPKTNKIGFKK